MRAVFLRFLFFTILTGTTFTLQAQSLNILSGSDTDHVCGSPVPVLQGAFFYLTQSGFQPTDTLTESIFWGDGDSTVYKHAVSQYNGGSLGYISGWHTYSNYGVYDLTFVVSGPNGVADTMVNINEVVIGTNCVEVKTLVYNDVNGNCLKDPGEALLNIPYKIYMGSTSYSDLEYDSISTVSPGYFYSYQLTQNGYSNTCPASGINNFYASGDTTIYFAVQCLPNVYDYRVKHFVTRLWLNDPALIFVYPSNPYCAVQNGNYSLTLPSQLTYINGQPVPAVSSNVYTWSHSNLNYLTQYQPVILRASLDPSLVMGDSVYTTAHIDIPAGDVNPVNNEDAHWSVVTGSYDPNNKFVQPRGYGSAGTVAPETEFTYLITFQNTGNNIAQDVLVVDTLTTNLDYRSFKVIYCSHQYKVYFPSDNVANFSFENINLPDSTSNEPASHGYIVYQMKARSGLANGTSILNRAFIYFDNNPAILTSATLNTIDYTLGMHEIKPNTVTIAPNPANSDMTLIADKPGDFSLQLYDVNGKMIRTTRFSGFSYKMDVSELPEGIYSGTLMDEHGLKSFRVIVVH